MYNDYDYDENKDEMIKDGIPESGQAGEEEIRDTTQAAQEPVKGKRKGRIVGIIAAGILFGSVSAITMRGVNFLLTTYVQQDNKESSLAQKSDLDTAQKEKLELKEAVKKEDDENSAIYVHSADVSGIVEEAMPFVVAINGTTKLNTFGWFGESREFETPSSGSGIIIGKNEEELLIVTNNHVVNDTDSLSTVFIDEESVAATVKGGDSESDIAIIAVKLSDIKEETLNRIDIATIGDSDALKVGQGVIAIGNALGYGQSVTVGYVSALNREVETRDGSIKNLLQTDAAINPGNSGGALLNMQGEVIGINSAKYSSTEVEGMGYAIPISKIKGIITELSSKETRSLVDKEKQGYIGIQGQNIDAEMAQLYDMPKGIYVYKIVEGGAAKNSELKEKDIILKLDGQSVKTMENLKKELMYYESGETVVLTVKRLEDSEYKEKEIEIRLGSRSDMQDE